jgi:ribosome-binding factor A
MSLRQEKVNALIKQQVAELMTREINFKTGILVTISKVDTSPDLRYTQIFVSVFPEKESEYAIKTLKKESFNLQGKLNKKIVMKPLPRIEFKLDPTEIKADEVEKLLQQI